MNKKFIDKDMLLEKIEEMLHETETTAHLDKDAFNSGRWKGLTELKEFVTGNAVEETRTWHLQEEDDIYDSFNDWSYHTFACLMKDGSVQKFSGILDESSDGTVNMHIDRIDDTQRILYSIDGDGNIEKPLNWDEYGVDDILYWSELPKGKDEK